MKPLLIVMAALVLLPGCPLNPWGKDDAKVELQKWERGSGPMKLYTATFKNTGDKDAKNVTAHLRSPCGKNNTMKTLPRYLHPGETAQASVDGTGCSGATSSAQVVSIRWD